MLAVGVCDKGSARYKLCFIELFDTALNGLELFLNACKNSENWAQTCKSVSHFVVQSLVVQLEEAAKQARLQACKLQQAVAANGPTAVAATAAAEGTAETSPGKGSSRGSVPGLQNLKGSWSGAFQAYGGGGGAANTDFDVKGTNWQWGNYSMDQVQCAESNIQNTVPTLWIFASTIPRPNRICYSLRVPVLVSL